MSTHDGSENRRDFTEYYHEDILREPATTVREVVFAERNWHVFQSHQRMVRSGDWLYTWNAWPERYSVSGESAWTKFLAAFELWAAAQAGKLTPAQALLTQRLQPAEMLFHVGDDPHQFHNFAADTKHPAVLLQARALLDQWKAATGDSMPNDLTPDRGGLHEATERKTRPASSPVPRTMPPARMIPAPQSSLCPRLKTWDARALLRLARAERSMIVWARASRLHVAHHSDWARAVYWPRNNVGPGCPRHAPLLPRHQFSFRSHACRSH